MIEPRYLTLRGMFTDRVFRISHYQRFYSWRTKQREDLFNDILRLNDRGGEDHHFMATVVCYRTPERTTVGTAEYRLYDVVDGQQRLTTLILLLKCVHLLLKESEESEDEQKELAQLLVKKDANLVLLQSNNANQAIFNRFLREGATPSDTEILTDADRNLAQAIHECQKFARDWRDNAKDLLNLLRIIQNRLGFVVYDTENARLVYNLFEVLNSRGLAVDWLDKCKSMLMGAAFELAASEEAADAAITALQSIWAQIYKQLADVSVSGQEILRVTATLRHGADRGKPQRAQESLELLRNECTDASFPEKISTHLLEVAKMLVALEKNVMLAPVTRILHARILAAALQSTDALSTNERGRALKQWENVTFRIFGLYGKDSRSKVGDYIRLAEAVMKKSEGGSRYSEIMESLREIGAEHSIEGAVDEGLSGTNIYESDDAICRYILWRYEEALARATGPGATIDEEARHQVLKLRASESIEHIFPQHPESGGAWDGKMCRDEGVSEPIEKHVHRIGNLILLPISLNDEVRRKGFKEKKDVYRRHHLRQIEEVCKKHKWTLKQIEAREKQIINWAKEEWADLTD